MDSTSKVWLLFVVLAVTSATLYFTEKNLRENRQRALDAQFQNQVRSFLAMQEARSGAIVDRCRALSRSSRWARSSACARSRGCCIDSDRREAGR